MEKETENIVSLLTQKGAFKELILNAIRIYGATDDTAYLDQAGQYAKALNDVEAEIQARVKEKRN